MQKVAQYVIDCENGEYESYTTYCVENDLDPKDVEGQEQVKHVYALALIGLGLEYPTNERA